MKSHVVVTGGSGFLGSHFVRLLLKQGSCSVTNVDSLTYAGDPRRLADVADGKDYEFVRLDIASEDLVRQLLSERRPEAVVHFAAESHVTRSETDPDLFYRTNVKGTRVLLEAALAAGVRRFIHVSTDEVYGSILEGSFKESDKQEGTGSAASPYSKSKALADDLALSYAGKLEVVVVRPTNAFGPWQYPEKVFPRWVTRALQSQPILVWGDGLYVRQWLHAEDFAWAVDLVLREGVTGEAYNVGPVHEPEITNLAVARWLTGALGLDNGAIRMTAYDRPDHDRRYAVDASKIRELGWRSGDVWSQFEESLAWYRNNPNWWRSLIAEAESIYADAGAAGKDTAV